MALTPEERLKLIDRLDRSWQAMPRWVKVSFKHASGAPSQHPHTGENLKTFRQVLDLASDETLETWKEDFESNGDLAPETLQ